MTMRERGAHWLAPSVALAWLGTFMGVVAIVITLSYLPERQDPMTVATNATVALVNDKGRAVCSGVILSEHYVLTNAHCVLNKTDVNVAYHDMDASRAAVVIYRGSPQDVDVAVLRVNEGNPYTPIPVRCTAPEYGEEIIVIGHPFGVTWTTTWGRVSHQDPKRDSRWLVNAMINPGNSGGTVLDNEGNLLAISTDMMAYRAGISGPSGHTGISGVTALSAVCQSFRSMGVMA